MRWIVCKVLAVVDAHFSLQGAPLRFCFLHVDPSIDPSMESDLYTDSRSSRTWLSKQVEDMLNVLAPGVTPSATVTQFGAKKSGG